MFGAGASFFKFLISVFPIDQSKCKRHPIKFQIIYKEINRSNIINNIWYKMKESSVNYLVTYLRHPQWLYNVKSEKLLLDKGQSRMFL